MLYIAISVKTELERFMVSVIFRKYSAFFQITPPNIKKMLIICLGAAAFFGLEADAVAGDGGVD